MDINATRSRYINLRKKVKQKCVTKTTDRTKTDIFVSSNPSGIQSMNCQDKSKEKRHINLTKYNVSIILQLVLGHLKIETYPPVNT